MRRQVARFLKTVFNLYSRQYIAPIAFNHQARKNINDIIIRAFCRANCRKKSLSVRRITKSQAAHTLDFLHYAYFFFLTLDYLRSEKILQKLIKTYLQHFTKFLAFFFCNLMINFLRHCH